MYAFHVLSTIFQLGTIRSESGQSASRIVAPSRTATPKFGGEP
jgi:hypothetical protein